MKVVSSLENSEQYYNTQAHHFPDNHIGLHVSIQNLNTKLWDIYGNYLSYYPPIQQVPNPPQYPHPLTSPQYPSPQTLPLATTNHLNDSLSIQTGTNLKPLLTSLQELGEEHNII